MQEQFSYSLMASGLGILIVFCLLVLLSGLMVLIKKLSDEKEPKKKEVKTPVKTPAKAAAAPAVQSSLPLPVLVAAAAEGFSGAGGPNWLIAAIAAYFASENDYSDAPSAKAWAATYQKYDPWVANNKLSKTVPGV